MSIAFSLSVKALSCSHLSYPKMYKVRVSEDDM